MDKAERQQHNARIARVQSKLIDAAEAIADTLAPDLDPAARKIPAPSVVVARRQIANLLKLSQFCSRSACRRSHCCRGEPLHCLQMALPLLPAEAFGGILRKQPARRYAALTRRKRFHIAVPAPDINTLA